MNLYFKVRRRDDVRPWEDILPEQIGNDITLAQGAARAQQIMQDDPAAVEVRINLEGSLQGCYFQRSSGGIDLTDEDQITAALGERELYRLSECDFAQALIQNRDRLPRWMTGKNLIELFERVKDDLTFDWEETISEAVCAVLEYGCVHEISQQLLKRYSAMGYLVTQPQAVQIARQLVWAGKFEQDDLSGVTDVALEGLLQNPAMPPTEVDELLGILETESCPA